MIATRNRLISSFFSQRKNSTINQTRPSRAATLRDARRREARESPRARARAVRLVRWSRPRRASRRASTRCASPRTRAAEFQTPRTDENSGRRVALFRARLSTAPADPPRTFRSSFPQVELIAQRREARRTKMLQEKAALHAERKTHGVDLDGVRFSRMVDAELSLIHI